MSRIIETVSLFVLLSVVGLRPLISERYDSAALDLTRALGVVEDASPATTLIIDGVILLAAIGWLVARAIAHPARGQQSRDRKGAEIQVVAPKSPRSDASGCRQDAATTHPTGGRDRAYRWTGVEWGGFILSIAAAVSCVFASNKRLAFNGAVDWLCCLLTGVVLVQLLTDRTRIRMALCVLAASGAAQAVECFHQVLFTFPETEAMYFEQRASLWREQGVPLDSERVELFENRLRSREAFGYLSHSNVTGAHLVLCGLIVAGLAWSQWKSPPPTEPRPSGSGHPYYNPPTPAFPLRTDASLPPTRTGEHEPNRAATVRERSPILQSPDARPPLRTDVTTPQPRTGEQNPNRAATVRERSPILQSPDARPPLRTDVTTPQPRAGRLSARGFPLITTAVSLVILAGAATTNSRGALAAGGVTVFLVAVRFAFDGACRRYARHLFAWGWTAVMLSVFAVVGHGIYHGALPGRSLDFRWKYWTASARMVADHPVTGVGSQNFGRYYLGYKSTDSPEEVKNPHNFIISAATDWGVGGVVGLCVILFGASKVLCRSKSEGGAPARESEENSWAVSARWALALALAIFVPRVWALGSDDPNYLYFQTVLPLLAWATVFIVLSVVPLGSLATLATALAFAVVAFLLQETIHFATLVPGTLVTVWACFATAVALRYVNGSRSVEHRMPAPGATLPVTVILFVVVLFLGILPVTRAHSRLSLARHSHSAEEAMALYAAASEADRWDSTAPYEWARLLRSAGSLDDAVARIDEAILRDPMDVRLHREKSRVHAVRAERTNNAADRTAAVESAARAAALYPTDPGAQVFWGDRLSELGRATGGRDALQSAIERYEEALRLDDARPEWEEVRKLRPRERASILAKMVDLRGVIATLDSEQ